MLQTEWALLFCKSRLVVVLSFSDFKSHEMAKASASLTAPI